MYTLPLGTITLQETKAPEGYLLNDTVYVAQTVLDSGNNTVRTTNLPTDDNAAQETPYEGTISIQKFLGGSTVKTSEPDAEFEIYLTSAGSYDAAPEESRQTITTDANGYAITRLTITASDINASKAYLYTLPVSPVFGISGLGVLVSFTVSSIQTGALSLYLRTTS